MIKVHHFPSTVYCFVSCIYLALLTLSHPPLPDHALPHRPPYPTHALRSMYDDLEALTLNKFNLTLSEFYEAKVII